MKLKMANVAIDSTTMSNIGTDNQPEEKSTSKIRYSKYRLSGKKRMLTTSASKIKLNKNVRDAP